MTFESFRAIARDLLAADVPPGDVHWEDDHGQRTLFAASVRARRKRTRTVPAAFVRAAEVASLHSDPARWDLLYRIAFRLTHGEPELLEVSGDRDVARLRAMVTAVRRDEHRMHAFVRFQRTSDDAYVAWYEPEHDVAELAAAHFVARFANMRWMILGPRRTVAWDGRALHVGPGAPRESAPAEDELAELFRAYYAAIFNPARTNLEAFAKHVPARYRRDMPETRAARDLIREAPERVRAMADKKTSPSLAFVPPNPDHDDLVRAARGCTACHLYQRATQTVFGEGPTPAALMLVGEQPGDQEDLQGHPFVGPAGRVLDGALEAADIPRDQVYVTNAVKHFKWEPRGKRRLHAKPNAVEIHACHGWLEAEIAVVKPQVIVCLGATAAQAFLGRKFSITKSRGELLDGAPWAPHILATYHPSAILRMMSIHDEAAYEKAKAELYADMAKAAENITFARARPRLRKNDAPRARRAHRAV